MRSGVGWRWGGGHKECRRSHGVLVVHLQLWFFFWQWQWCQARSGCNDMEWWQWCLAGGGKEVVGVDEGHFRRSIGFQISLPSRFVFPTADSSFHLQDSNQNQFHFLLSLTSAPSNGLSVKATWSAHGAVRDDTTRGWSAIGTGTGQRKGRRHGQAVQPARCGRGKG
jgi:hypothetical protein